MDCDYILREEIIEKYCLGKLDEKTRELYENHLKHCERCRIELKNQQEMIVLLKESGQMELRDALNRQLQELQKTGSFNKFLLLKVASVLLFISLIPGVLYYNRHIATSRSYDIYQTEKSVKSTPEKKEITNKSIVIGDSALEKVKLQEKGKAAVRKQKADEGESIAGEAGTSGSGVVDLDNLKDVFEKSDGTGQEIFAPPAPKVQEEIGEPPSSSRVSDKLKEQEVAVLPPVSGDEAEETVDLQDPDQKLVITGMPAGEYQMVNIADNQIQKALGKNNRMVMVTESEAQKPEKKYLLKSEKTTMLVYVISEKQPQPGNTEAVPDSFRVELVKNLSQVPEMTWYLPLQLFLFDTEKIRVTVEENQNVIINFDGNYFYRLILSENGNYAYLIKDKK